MRFLKFLKKVETDQKYEEMDIKWIKNMRKWTKNLRKPIIKLKS